MSECGLQDTPKDDLSFFDPTLRRHHRQEKVDNHHARNYTLKLPLSPIVTMHYAAALSCRKRGFRGPPNECPSRPDEARPGLGRRRLLTAVGVAGAFLKALRSHPDCPCPQAMKSNVSGALWAQIAFARVRCLFARCSQCGRCESRFPGVPVVHSMGRLDFRFLPVEFRAQMNPGGSGFSV